MSLISPGCNERPGASRLSGPCAESSHCPFVPKQRTWVPPVVLGSTNRKDWPAESVTVVCAKALLPSITVAPAGSTSAVGLSEAEVGVDCPVLVAGLGSPPLHAPRTTGRSRATSVTTTPGRVVGNHRPRIVCTSRLRVACVKVICESSSEHRALSGGTRPADTSVERDRDHGGLPSDDSHIAWRKLT